MRRYLALLVFAVALLACAGRGDPAGVAAEDGHGSPSATSSFDRPPSPPPSVPQFVDVAPALSPATTLNGHPDVQRADVHRPASRLAGFALAANLRPSPSRHRLFPLLI